MNSANIKGARTPDTEENDASIANQKFKSLTLVVSNFGRPAVDQLIKFENEDQEPRSSLFERVLNSDLLDERMMSSVSRMKKLLYKFLPSPVSKSIEAFLRKNQYDVIISWGERYAILFGLLLKFTFSKKPHVALVYWISKQKQSFFLKKAQSHIDRMITWSSVQRNYAINTLNISPSKVTYIPYGVDQKFWRPMESNEARMICSVGEEMRDYTTLLKAIEGLNIPCHIVASQVRIIGQYKSEWKPINSFGPFPDNVTVGIATYAELRKIYARSKFVVLPLLPSETSSGLTVMLEAMAMEKAVICTRSKAQVDVLLDGITGMFVEGGDPQALREAIQYLWNNPDKAEKMGKEARQYIEEHHSLDQFVDGVKNIVQSIINPATR